MIGKYKEIGKNIYRMLIPFSQIYQFLKNNNIELKGILHLGAHKCEELEAYKAQGISEDKIAWIEAQGDLVKEMKSRGVKNIFNHCILDVETTVPFWKTTNGESSSVLEFQTHATHHPHVPSLSKFKYTHFVAGIKDSCHKYFL